MRTTAGFEALCEPLDEVLELLGRRGGHVSVLATEESSLTISVDDRKQDIVEAPLLRGVVLRAFDGQGFAEYATDGAPRAALVRAARSLGARARQSPLPPTTGTGSFETACAIDPIDVRWEEKFDRVRELQRRTRSLEPRGINARAVYRESVRLVRFLSRAARLTQRVVRVNASLVLFVSEDRRTEYGRESHGGTAGFELSSFSDGEFDRLRETAGAMLRAERVQPGTYDVVCSPEASGLVAHEAFGHGVEMDLYPKERARSAAYLGKPVASPLVTMLDDPSVPGAYGSFFFDDEGHAAAPTTVIRDGVYVSGLADDYAALSLGRAPTPNGRRESYRRKAYARMTNTFFARGDLSPDEVLARVDRGIYLDQGSSGIEDPKAWGIQVTMHNAREIVAGRITGRTFKQIGVTGYVPELLGSISAVGDDFLLDPGTCGKGYKEMVPISAGGPTLLLRARLS